MFHVLALTSLSSWHIQMRRRNWKIYAPSLDTLSLVKREQFPSSHPLSLSPPVCTSKERKMAKRGGGVSERKEEGEGFLYFASVSPLCGLKQHYLVSLAIPSRLDMEKQTCQNASTHVPLFHECACFQEYSLIHIAR